MDDTQNMLQNTGDDSTGRAAPPQSQQPSVREEKIPASPVSLQSKESGPAVSPSSEILAVPSVHEMEVPKELHEMGVEAVSESPTLTSEDAQAGVVHAKESTSVSSVPAATVVLPMTQQQAQQTVKVHKRVKDSLFWLAMLILRQWQIAKKNK